MVVHTPLIHAHGCRPVTSGGRTQPIMSQTVSSMAYDNTAKMAAGVELTYPRHTAASSASQNSATVARSRNMGDVRPLGPPAKAFALKPKPAGQQPSSFCCGTGGSAADDDHDVLGTNGNPFQARTIACQ